MYNHLQEKKVETCSEEQVMTVRERIQDEEYNDIIDAEPSSNQEVTKKKGKTNSRRMMSRMQY